MLVHAPQKIADPHIADIIEAERFWIYSSLAEWRDLNATRLVREYRNGEGFLCLGRSHRLLLVEEHEDLVMLKGGRFCLRRELADLGDVAAAQSAFRDYYIARGMERIAQRVANFVPKVGVQISELDVWALGYRWASCSPTW